jgi:hypothetical protein
VNCSNSYAEAKSAGKINFLVGSGGKGILSPFLVANGDKNSPAMFWSSPTKIWLIQICKRIRYKDVMSKVIKWLLEQHCKCCIWGEAFRNAQISLRHIVPLLCVCGNLERLRALVILWWYSLSLHFFGFDAGKWQCWVVLCSRSAITFRCSGAPSIGDTHHFGDV